VKLAKADLVPTSANLGDDYASLAELEAACAAFCAEVNARPHRVTRRPPIELLAEERARLHPLPAAPYTLAFGETRIVGTASPMVTFEHGQYSVPHRLAGQVVWVRAHGKPGRGRPRRRGRAGRSRPACAHQPWQPQGRGRALPTPPAGPLVRTPQARTSDEAAFLALGDGAAVWLAEAAAAGTTRIRAKMAHAVALAKLGDPTRVSWALGHAAVTGRFDEGDLAAILAHQATATPGSARRAAEHASLAQGTAGWSRLDPAAATGAPAKAGGDR
jgi:Mu transposase, C-terminal domain